jgi:hypothetical protein
MMSAGFITPFRHYIFKMKHITSVLFAAVFWLCCTASFAQALNITVYVVPAITNTKIFSNSAISSTYKTSNIVLSAAKGEYESASFVLNPDADLLSLIIEATNLTGTRDIIPASNVDIRVVKVWWQAGVGVDDLTHKQLTPELLLKDDSLVRVSGSDNFLRLTNGTEVKISDPNGIRGISDRPTNDEFPVRDSQLLLPVNLSKNLNKQFWITLRVPDNAFPGNYSGRIHIKNSSQILKTLNLKVTVLPIKLSEPKLVYSIYYASYLTKGMGTVDSTTRNEQQYRAELRNLVSHGVTNPQINGPFGYSLSVRSQEGMSNKIIYLLGFRIKEYIGNIDSLKAEVIKLKATAANYSVDTLYIYGIDEQDLDTPAIRAAISAVHELGVKVFCAEWYSHYQTSIADVLDLLVDAQAPDPALAALYHGYGHKIFNYENPQAGVEQPDTYRRNYGLLLWQKDYDGAMDFAYMWHFYNIWNDFDGIKADYGHRYRDTNFVYPTVDGVIDTVQWEGFREGVDDSRYLSTLMDRVTYAKRKGLNVSSVEKWIADLKKTDLSGSNLDNVRKDMIAKILSLPEPVCSPGEESGCKACKSDGSAWVDNSSKCASGLTCKAGVCQPAIIKCASNASVVYRGAIIQLSQNVTAGSYPISRAWFELNRSMNYSSSGNTSERYWRILNTSSLLGNYSVRCWINDTLNNRVYLDDSSFRVITTTSTTTTTSSTTTTSTTSTTSSTSSTSITSSSTSTSSTTSTTISQCVMQGNYPPCDAVTLSEIVDAINGWAAGNQNIGEVIGLINSWADPEGYPPK